MSTDFNYGEKQIVISGPIKPNGKDMPSDARERVDCYADIANIPNPYVGLKITVKVDETNNNKMTDYIVKSLKADSIGIANMAINEVIRYVDYLGVSSSSGGTGAGLTTEQAQQLQTAYEHSQSVHVQASDIPSLNGYATETFVTSKIAEASLSGGEVDLSGYATKDDLKTKANTSHTHVISDVTDLDLSNIDAASLNGKKLSNLMTKDEYDTIDVKDPNTIYLVDDDTVLEGIPSYSVSDTGKVLAVNSTGTGLVWVSISSSGGGSEEPKTLTSISAVYNQGSTAVYPSTNLDSLKNNLTVTATYSDSSNSVISSGYSLSGNLTVGTSTITVTYSGKTTTFNVTVSEEITPSEPVDATGLTVNPSEATIFVGKNKTFNCSVTPSEAESTTNVTWSVDNEHATISPSGKSCTLTGVTSGSVILTATSGNLTSTATVTIADISGSPEEYKVFSIDPSCYNNDANTLTDSKNNIAATIVGTPTISNDIINFTADDTFSFDISSLNLSSYTMRFKYQYATRSSNSNIITIGQGEWGNSFTFYQRDGAIVLNGSTASVSNNTVGSTNLSGVANVIKGGISIGDDVEIVLSYNSSTRDIRVWVDGTLAQDGTVLKDIHTSLTKLCNTEGSVRFVGGYKLIELYDKYYSSYPEFI